MNKENVDSVINKIRKSEKKINRLRVIFGLMQLCSDLLTIFFGGLFYFFLSDYIINNFLQLQEKASYLATICGSGGVLSITISSFIYFNKTMATDSFDEPKFQRVDDVMDEMVRNSDVDDLIQSIFLILIGLPFLLFSGLIFWENFIAGGVALFFISLVALFVIPLIVMIPVTLSVFIFSSISVYAFSLISYIIRIKAMFIAEVGIIRTLEQQLAKHFSNLVGSVVDTLGAGTEEDVLRIVQQSHPEASPFVKAALNECLDVSSVELADGKILYRAHKLTGGSNIKVEYLDDD